MYSSEEVTAATLSYFEGDELATNVFMTKYALKGKNGEFLEKTPDDMHRRLAGEFARMEAQKGEGQRLRGQEAFGDWQRAEEEFHLRQARAQ